MIAKVKVKTTSDFTWARETCSIRLGLPPRVA